ncbi:MAG: branched-chain amino acid ABC transporter permease [Candidatus Bathyarchaeia archaeon]
MSGVDCGLEVKPGMIDTPTLFIFLLNSLLYASSLFLVAAGLQLVFGVLTVINLAVGSFYALGAYFGIEITRSSLGLGLPTYLGVFMLIAAAGLALVIGPPIEVALLRPMYKREAEFQLLLTYGIVLIFEDLIKMFWGLYPRSISEVYVTYGGLSFGGITFPIYNLIVIIVTFIIAGIIGFMLKFTKTGIITRATSHDKEMSSALGANVKRVYLIAFTIGTALGILSGALMVPIQTAVPGLSIEVIVIAFAIVVIGGLGSIKGALIGSLIVGFIRSAGIALFPEVELAIIYLAVIAVLLIKPSGLFGKVGG